MLSAFFFVACNRSDAVVSNTITVLDEEQTVTSSGYSDSLNAMITDLILLNTNVEKVPVSVAKDIKAVSDEADRLLKSYDISDKQYVALKNDLDTNRYKYAISISNLMNDRSKDEDLKNLKSFLGINTRTLGKEIMSDYIYDLLYFRLGYVYNQRKESYEKTGLRESAYLEAKSDFETFGAKINRDNFGKVFSNSMLLFDIMTSSSGADSFALTDEEIEILIKIPDFNNDIDKDGSTILMKVFADLMLNDKTYAGSLYKKAKDNSEIMKFGEKMPVLISFICSVQSKINTEIVSSLTGGIEHIILSLRPYLDDEEWTMLENIFSIELTANYDIVALEFYGTEYNLYKENVKKYTIDDIKTATEENIEEIFEGIIANISPAFSYGWKND